MPQPQPVELVVQVETVRNPGVILVNKNDIGDEVVRNVQQQNLAAHNSIANWSKPLWHKMV